MSLRLEHRVHIADGRAHLIEVTTTVRSDGPLPSPLTVFMAVWTPGSYLVREYARHVEGMSAERDGAPVAIKKVRKNAWQCEPAGAHAVTLRYRVYCNELTVRTNHVDGAHAYLNGAPTFVAVDGHEGAPVRVLLAPPEGWKVATALTPSKVDAPGYLAFEAEDMDTLVDSPIEMGTHREVDFDVLGVPHRYAVAPAHDASDADLRRLVQDTRTILETEGRLWGGTLPYARYLLLLHLSPRNRGGLEHASSATLVASPTAFASRDGYLDLLALVAHEVFHAWNVKRVRPRGFLPYRYQEESYTRLLWWFEGGTSYYDWRTLRLAGLCTVPEYLAHLADEIAYLDATPGRLVHPLEEASFDAWIKLYRPDENSTNSTVSYYRKGELVCALLDLEIRARTGGKMGLDALLPELWTRFGATGDAVPEDGLEPLLEAVTGLSLRELTDPWVRGAGELPYEGTLAKVGLTLERFSRSDGARAAISARLRTDAGRVWVAQVLRGGAAQRAGLDAGDELLALNGRRMEGTSVDGCIGGRVPGDTVDAIVAREGRVLTLPITLDEPRKERVKIMPDPKASSEKRALFAGWLGEPHPAWGPP